MDSFTYANIVGTIMYVMICMHPDIAYVVSIVSRFKSIPGQTH